MRCPQHGGSLGRQWDTRRILRSAFAACIGLGFDLVKDIEQEDAEIAIRAALTCLQQRLCTTEEDIGCGGPVLLFCIPRRNHAELLVGLIVLAFCDSV